MAANRGRVHSVVRPERKVFTCRESVPCSTFLHRTENSSFQAEPYPGRLHFTRQILVHFECKCRGKLSLTAHTVHRHHYQPCSTFKKVFRLGTYEYLGTLNLTRQKQAKALPDISLRKKGHLYLGTLTLSATASTTCHLTTKCVYKETHGQRNLDSVRTKLM